MEYLIDKSKCIGCGICVAYSLRAIELKSGKAEIVKPSSEHLEGVEKVCPKGAIKLVEKKEDIINWKKVI